MTLSQITFQVRGSTIPGEVIAICGNCDSLGNWKPQNAAVLSPDANDCTLWRTTVSVTRGTPVQYRYFKGSFLEPKTTSGPCQVIIHKWETHLQPRSIFPLGAVQQASDMERLNRPKTAPCCSRNPKLTFPLKASSRSAERQTKTSVLQIECLFDDGQFGVHNGIETVDSGWLTCQTEIRLRLHYSEKLPVSITKKKFKKSRFRVKLTLEGLEEEEEEEEEEDDDHDKTSPLILQRMGNTLEISLISDQEFQSRHSQPECGYALLPDRWTEYSIHTMEPDNLELLFDFFEEDLSEAIVQGDTLPGHVGTACLLSSTIAESGKSSGILTLPIMSRNSRKTIGKVRVDYIVIRPIKNYSCDMKKSYSRYWKPRTPLDVGHRGAGNSTTTAQLAKIRENTVASLKNAASHGAAYVEFDVHLSKDCVPLIYHDLTCCISMRKKLDADSMELFEIPVKELTYDQLQLLKLSHATALKLKDAYTATNEEENSISDNQPFPSLQMALESVSEDVGFNIEIKWICQQRDGVWDGNLSTYFDMNMFLDIILKTVLEKSGRRRILFSSFDADICTMVRLKQNQYPILFLTQGQSSHYPELMDLRSRTTHIAISFAQFENILGINVHTEDLLKNPSYIQEAKSKGLVIFCWGDDTNDPENRKLMREYGIDGLIYDRIYDWNPEQPNVFQVEQLERLKKGLPEGMLRSCLCPTVSHFVCSPSFCMRNNAYMEANDVNNIHMETNGVHNISMETNGVNCQQV